MAVVLKAREAGCDVVGLDYRFAAKSGCECGGPSLLLRRTPWLEAQPLKMRCLPTKPIEASALDPARLVDRNLRLGLSTVKGPLVGLFY